MRVILMGIPNELLLLTYPSSIQVRAFLEGLPANAVVADVGCGNGKYFGVRRDLAVLGSDRSEGG
jgi:hypothetical protein